MLLIGGKNRLKKSRTTFRVVRLFQVGEPTITYCA
jgi:hypothetical protein